MSTVDVIGVCAVAYVVVLALVVGRLWRERTPATRESALRQWWGRPPVDLDELDRARRGGAR